ncbi:MAG: hypothetical protein DRP29_00255 [Thermodesulfobacteriota bacterium]|nr:MAG: hypothetical protein DRP29_00255 [Thermodesulfobacteriota bacterium]
MADYPDWTTPNWLVDQATELYYADIFAPALAAIVVTGKAVIKPDKELLVYGYVLVQDEGMLINFGKATIFLE